MTTLPGAFPGVACFEGRIYVSTELASGGMRVDVVDASLQHVDEIVVPQVEARVAAPMREIRPGVLTWWEMAGVAWPRYELDLKTRAVSRAGETKASGNLQARDGYVLSNAPGGGGFVNVDGVDLVLPDAFTPGYAQTAGGWVLVIDHSNTVFLRKAPGTPGWETHAAQGEVRSAVLHGNGDVTYGGAFDLRFWGSGDNAFSLAPWSAKGCAWTDGPWAAFSGRHIETETQQVFLTPTLDGRCNTLNRATTESWIRTAWLDGVRLAVVTWHAYQQPATTTLDLVDTTIPLTLPIEPGDVGPPDPPDPPPPGGDMTVDEKLDKIIKEQADQLQVLTAIGLAVGGLQDQVTRVEGVARSARTGQVGNSGTLLKAPVVLAEIK